MNLKLTKGSSPYIIMGVFSSIAIILALIGLVPNPLFWAGVGFLLLALVVNSCTINPHTVIKLLFMLFLLTGLILIIISCVTSYWVWSGIGIAVFGFLLAIFLVSLKC